MSTTTKVWTWAGVWALLEQQLDLENENIVDEEEMCGYANEAIDHCEGIINGINEEYFLKRSTITVVSGTDSYDIPTSMYANKIRSVIYYNGTDVYVIDRIPTLSKFIEYRLSRANSETADEVKMQYFLANHDIGDPQIIFTPAPTGGSIEVWHYRNANRLVFGSVTPGDLTIDLPECIQYIFDYCHERFAWKLAAGGARHQTAIKRMADTEAKMVIKLKPAIVDGNEDIEMDMSVYEEHN